MRFAVLRRNGGRRGEAESLRWACWLAGLRSDAAVECLGQNVINRDDGNHYPEAQIKGGVEVWSKQTQSVEKAGDVK
jgi:hypothetical protein